MKPLQDYSFIKGVNYGLKTDPAIVRRDLSYARRLGLNSVRIWLSYHRFEEIAAWHRQESPNAEDVRAFAYELAETLRRACHIL